MREPLEPAVETLLRHADAAGERPALRTGERVLTYAGLARCIRHAARRLRKLGVQRQERVILCGENSATLAAAYFGIHLTGAAALPVSPRLSRESCAFLERDSGAVLALTARSMRANWKIRCEDLETFTEAAEIRESLSPACTLDGVADILYTTGTTGRPKGVVLTHRNAASAALNICTFIGTHASDSELVPLPLSHSFGLGRLRCMALTGHTLILEAGMPNPAHVLRRLLDSRATGLALVPSGFALLLSLPREHLARARTHLRYIEIGSAPMREDLRRALMDLLPRTRICHHYGLTEASRACFREFHGDADKPDSVGRASPNVEVEIRDENGRTLPPGSHGEIAVRGGMVMQGYLNLPELTARTLSNGWLRTGDYGRQDRDGHVYLLGRRTEIINVGGLKVAPMEIETHLSRFPHMQECACVGVPDRVLGEKVKLFYVAENELAPAAVVNWLRAHLEEHKIPREFERVAALPKTESGKIQRHLLREGDGGGASCTPVQ